MNAGDLEKLCMSFKGTTQDIKWGNDLCYLIGEKMYCTTSVASEEGAQFISFKTSPEDFGLLTEREGIIPAPYSARHYWILVKTFRSLSPKEWKMYIRKSYDMVFEKFPTKKKAAILK